MDMNRDVMNANDNIAGSIRFITSEKFLPEKKYCLGVIENYLGVPICIAIDNAYSNRYAFAVDGKQSIACRDVFFAIHQEDVGYIQESNIPTSIDHLDAKEFGVVRLPIIFGDEQFSVSDDQISIGLDIIGSMFFMLSRWEEIANTSRDHYDRFSAKDSVAFKFNFLLRPVVDEYCELLRVLINQFDCQFDRPSEPKARIRYTCDVDHIVDPSTSNIYGLTKSLLRTAIGKYPSRPIVSTLKRYLRGENAYDCFDYIFKSLHHKNIEGAFYFITGGNSQFDGTYDFMEQDVSILLQKISQNGFEVGLHPSFMTYKDSEQTKLEFDKLRRHAEQVSIHQDLWGGRQHYLRWDPEITKRNWEKAGLSYDSTLGYADHVGFRAGTCRDHKLFDPIERREVNLIERPLMLMDVTLVDKHYMDYGYSQKAYETIQNLKEQCALYGGSFNFLWHNSHLSTDEDRALFEYCID